MKTFKRVVLLVVIVTVCIIVFSCSQEQTSREKLQTLIFQAFEENESNPVDSAIIDQLCALSDSMPKECTFSIKYLLEDYCTDSINVTMNADITVHIEHTNLFAKEIVSLMYTGLNFDSLWLHDYKYPENVFAQFDSSSREMKAWTAGVQYLGETAEEQIQLYQSLFILLIEECTYCDIAEMRSTLQTRYGTVIVSSHISYTFLKLDSLPIPSQSI